MTETPSLPLKRELLNEWLADTQDHVFHTKKRKTHTPSSPSLSLPSLSSPSSVASNEDDFSDDRSLLSLPTLTTTTTMTTHQPIHKKTRKVVRLDNLERKVDRLLNDNHQLKQCAHVLEWQHHVALSETEAKEAKIAALEKQLAAARELLLLNHENDDSLV
ncbi:hypothetical protein BCR42DRAFT_428241, partial [Absidia repens]